jgi:hypothetical protein
MVNRAQRHFKTDSEPNLPFMIYQNEDDLDVTFLHWTVTLYLGQNVTSSIDPIRKKFTSTSPAQTNRLRSNPALRSVLISSLARHLITHLPMIRSTSTTPTI